MPADLTRLLAVVAVARLHVGGLGLAVLLLVKETGGSLAAAGLAAGALSLGVGLTRPLQGRLIDRAGPRALAAVAALHAVSGAALLLAGSLPLVFALGFTVPALSVVTRAACVTRSKTSRRPFALGADSALQSCAYVLGPLLAGAVAAAASPATAVVSLLIVGCAGALGATRLAVLPDRRRGREPVAFRRLLRPLAASVGQGIVYGALGVGAVAVVLEADRERFAGLAVALVFAGGLIGDVLIGPRRPRTPLTTRASALLAAVALVAVAPTVGVLLAGLLAAGACLAAVGVKVLLGIAERAPRRARAEAFGWAGATLRLGDAIGAGTAGVVAEQAGAGTALLVPIAGAALTLLIGVYETPIRLRAGSPVPVQRS